MSRCLDCGLPLETVEQLEWRIAFSLRGAEQHYESGDEELADHVTCAVLHFQLKALLTHIRGYHYMCAVMRRDHATTF